MDATTEKNNSAEDFSGLSRLAIVNKILKLLCQLTGLRIALVARVTDNSWTASAVFDEANFGIKPGDNLELQTTY